MESAALEQIIALAKASMQSPETHIPTAVVPENCKIVSLEGYQSAPSAFRGVMSTRCMSNYARYVEDTVKAGASDVVTFVDAEKMSAKTFFDLGTVALPLKAEHTALLGLEKTAPFTALLAANGCVFSQKTLIEWLEDWLPHITGVETEDSKPMPISAAIHAIRNITIEAKAKTDHVEGNMRSARSAMEEVEANSKGLMPGIIEFSCIPYTGLASRAFKMRVSILTGDDKPKLRLRICALEAAQEEMAEEFKSKLEQFLSANSTVYVGSFITK